MAFSYCMSVDPGLFAASPPADLVKTLGAKILSLNGFVNPYSQVKWIFSIKMDQHKALILFKPSSHAKMAPDSGSRAQATDCSMAICH
jgi:hypothetical protein